MPSRVVSLSLLTVLAVAGGLVIYGCAPAHFATRASAPARGPSTHALAVVRVPAPWYAPRFVIRGVMRKLLPQYEALAPLEAKYFTISDDGQFGGVYYWASRADAEKHFGADWREKVRQQRGVEGDLLIMDAPYVVDGPAVPLGESMGARSMQYPAWASLVRWELGDEARVPAAAQVLAAGAWASPTLVRGFVVSGPTWVGVAALWATREGAETAASATARDGLGTSLGATSATSTTSAASATSATSGWTNGSSALLFEAPLLIDATLR